MPLLISGLPIPSMENQVDKQWSFISTHAGMMKARDGRR